MLFSVKQAMILQTMIMFSDSDDDMFSSDTSVMSAKDVSFDNILGDTTLRDKLNQTDDGRMELHYSKG